MSRVLAAHFDGVEVYFGQDYDFGLGKMRLSEVDYTSGRSIFRFVGEAGELLAGRNALVEAIKRQERKAETNAEKLLTEGYHCISGKYLKVARWAHPLTAGFGAVDNGPEGLRKRLAEKPDQVEVHTVDVDTYVALKKLRRSEERRFYVPPPMFKFRDPPTKLYDYQQEFLHLFKSAADVAPPHRGGVVNVRNGIRQQRGPALRTMACSAEARYIASLEALPDSLYKRTQLRLVRLPRSVRKDHVARKKTFDRELAKRNAEHRPALVKTIRDVLNTVPINGVSTETLVEALTDAILKRMAAKPQEQQP